AMSSTIVCSDEEAKKFIRQEQAKVPPLINNNQKLNGNIIKEIRSIISEQTGYATDMLDVSLDLLADLGIDTVKQVEIIGKIIARFDLEIPFNLKLSELNTIDKINDYVHQHIKKNESSDTNIIRETIDRNLSGDVLLKAAFNNNIKRFVLKLKEVKLAFKSNDIFKGKTILITTDSYGFAQEIGEYIKESGGRIITIGNEAQNDYKIDLSDLDNIENNLNKIVENIDALIHLLPLNFYFNIKSDVVEINSSVKSLFFLVKRFYDDLNREGSLISSLSFNSVIFPYNNKENDIMPLFAGIAGMFKSLNKEMPATLFKITDFNVKKPLENVKELCRTYIRELQSGDCRVETGYKNNKKYVLTLKELDVKDETDANSWMDNLLKKQPKPTLLITGGASGISFEFARLIAKKYNVNLVIAGKTPLDAVDMKFIDESFDDTALLREFKLSMKGCKPIEIKAAIEKVYKIRSINNNITNLKKLAVSVSYEALDLADFNQVKALIDKYPHIDGIIHGAGMEESNFIVKKDKASFNRVFDSKVSGALNLINAMADRDYAFFISFSSVAAKFGNEGQSDYAAANEMLCKIILKEKDTYPDRFYKVINWTAWQGAGMANKESVLKVLTDRGIDFLPVAQGLNFFEKELNNESDIECVITGKNEIMDADAMFDNSDEMLSPGNSALINNIIDRSPTKCESIYTFSMAKDLYLYSHFYNEQPVVPAAFNAELMIANSALLADNYVFAALRDFNMFYVIKLLNEKDRQVRIVSEILSQNEEFVSIKARIVSDVLNFKNEIAEKDKLHYECIVDFAKLPQSFNHNDFEFKNLLNQTNVKKIDIHKLYHPTLLFMGAKMQPVKDISFISKEITIAKLSYSDFSIIDAFDNSEFVLDPIFFDGCLQAAVNILGIFYGFTGLPAAMQSVCLYKKIDYRAAYTVIAKLKSQGFDVNDKSYLFDIILLDKQGDVVLFINNFKGLVSLPVNQDLMENIALNTELIKEGRVIKLADILKPNRNIKVLSLNQLPFIDKKIGEEADKIVFSRTLEMNKDLFLEHHCKSGIPLFLAATGIEAMAEAAYLLYKRAGRLVGINDFAIPYGIKILKGRPKEIFIQAQRLPNEDEAFKTSIYSYFVNREGRIMGEHTKHYEALCSFAADFAETPKVNVDLSKNLNIEGIKELLYHPERLFMDGLFKTIDDLISFKDNTLICRFLNTQSKQFFALRDKYRLLADVITLDGMFQTCGVIELISTNNLVLPYEISQMKIFAETDPNKQYYCITKKLSERNDACDYSIELFDDNMNILISIEKMRMVKMYKLPDEFSIMNKFKEKLY
ncbi:MAG: SDR family NAD(P)-dependent oxidoreductase, partial [Bacteroidales bacterium]|nr:SDR family NAD(P)-dependent oxidoreductase [Bacteroidales bacterium]